MTATQAAGFCVGVASLVIAATTWALVHEDRRVPRGFHEPCLGHIETSWIDFHGAGATIARAPVEPLGEREARHAIEHAWVDGFGGYLGSRVLRAGDVKRVPGGWERTMRETMVERADEKGCDVIIVRVGTYFVDERSGDVSVRFDRVNDLQGRCYSTHQDTMLRRLWLKLMVR